MRRTPRYRWIFLRREEAGTIDDYGIPTESFTFITSGLFGKERAKRAVEVIDGGATVGSTQYVLIGAYSRHYHTAITSDLIAWCPALGDEILELIESPIDLDGRQESLLIPVVDNVERVYDTGSFPTS